MGLIQDLDILLGSIVNTNENLVTYIWFQKKMLMTIYISYLSIYLTYPSIHPSIWIWRWKLVWIVAKLFPGRHARERTKWCTKHANHGQCGGEVETTSSRLRNLRRSHRKLLVYHLHHIGRFRVDHLFFHMRKLTTFCPYASATCHHVIDCNFLNEDVETQFSERPKCMECCCVLLIRFVGSISYYVRWWR